jgi:transcriptional regulator with XRE-family HTH domain
LRAAMAAAGLGVRELARKLGWSHPYLSHLLSGNRSVSEIELLSVLFACNVHRTERERLLRLSGELGHQGWLQQYDSDVPEAPRTLIEHERKALAVTEVQLMALPKLLQTEAYAHAAIGATKGIEARTRARLARQEIFDQHPRPRMTFFLHEFSLRAVTAGASVTSEQLHHLLRMSVRPGVEIRIIPAGTHVGRGGSFSLLEFAAFHPVVYLEGEVTAVFLEQPHQIAAYQRILTALADTALSHNDSKTLLTTMAGQVGS